MLKQFFLALATLFGLFVFFLVTVVANSRFTMSHPQDPKVKILLTDHGAVRMKENTSSEKARVPKVEIVEEVFHFGSMVPEAKGKHSFEIRNVGTAPLTLKVESTSCKCTVGGVSSNKVAPGDKALVTLEWNAKYKDQEYAQSATVRTNDPVRPLFSLRVEGKVRQLLGTETEELLVPPITPGKAGTADMIVYSLNWESLEILNTRTTLPGVVTQILPAEPADLKRLEAKSALRVRVTVPGNLPAGEFRDAIRIKATSADKTVGTAELELPVRGRTLTRYAVNGPFSEDGGLLIGQVPQGVGKTVRLSIKLRDQDLSFPVQKIEVEPSYLKVTVEPHQEADLPTPGLYDVTIEVPADAPVGQYMGNPQGSLKITSGHPRVPEVTFKVMLAVVP